MSFRNLGSSHNETFKFKTSLCIGVVSREKDSVEKAVVLSARDRTQIQET